MLGSLGGVWLNAGTVSPGTVSPSAISPGAISLGTISPGAIRRFLLFLPLTWLIFYANSLFPFLSSLAGRRRTGCLSRCFKQQCDFVNAVLFFLEDVFQEDRQGAVVFGQGECFVVMLDGVRFELKCRFKDQV